MALGAFWVWAKYLPHWMGPFLKIFKFGFLSPIVYELSTLAAPPPYLQHATASTSCKRSVQAHIQLDIIDKVLDISDMDKFVTRYLFLNAGMIITQLIN